MSDLFDDLEDVTADSIVSSVKTEVVPREESSEEEEMLEAWGIKDNAIEEVKKASRIYNMKHGLFAGVPILCRGKHCSYSNVCSISLSDRTIGMRCPIEAGAILARFEAYCRTFNVGLGKYTLPEEQVDLTLIKDLVDIEVQILRADNKIAMSGDFIGETLHTVDKKGNPWYEEVVTPEVEFKYNLMEKRHKILQLLNSTRKDSKEIQANDPSVKASIIMRKVQELKSSGALDDGSVIDVELNDDNLVNDDGTINYNIIDELADKL